VPEATRPTRVQADARPHTRHLGVWIALFVLLGGVFARAMSPAEPFPWWEADAFGFAPPLTGLTPSWALLVNIVILLASAAVIGLSRGGPGRAGSVLLSIGFGVIGLHAVRDMETVSAGSDLAAGFATLAAVWSAGRVPGARRVAVALGLGFGVLLAAVGAEDVYIDHPRTVAAFESSKGSFYAAKGWDPGGPEAAMYEERLSHADPTAWFGLTNVLATFVAASAVGLFTVAMTAPASRVVRLATVAGAGAAAWVLVMTGSKGAIGSAALGALVFAVGWAARREWTARALGIAAMLVVAAVAVRGVVGERLSERSLLFRSQYQIGTLAVFAESPLTGVGPGQFQDAYTRLKPPDAPEDVTSPHSVGFDLIGLLGLGGTAWVGLLALGWAGKVHEALDESGAPANRSLVRFAGGVIGVGVVASAMTTRQALGLEAAAAMLLGSIGWLVVSGLCLAFGGSLRAAGLAAAGVSLVHAQLDISPVWSVSAPLWGLLVGGGLASIGADRPIATPWRGAIPGCAALLAGLLASRWVGMSRWESGLHDAAAWPSRIALARAETEGALERGDATALSELGARVGAWLGTGRPIPAQELHAAMDFAAMRAQEDAEAGLGRALDARGTHTGTRIALGRVMMTIAMRDASGSPVASRAKWDQAVASAEEGTRFRPDDPDAWSWLGTVCDQRARTSGMDPLDRAAWLQRAADAWILGDHLNPHSPSSAARIADIQDQLGQNTSVDWARQALERDDRLRLDPKRRMNPDRRGWMERLAAGGPAGTVDPDKP
jgi:hypothetical protein